jgi:glycogen operon protein
MYLDGRGIRNRDENGRRLIDDCYLIQLHAGSKPVRVNLPGPPWADGYELVVSTEYATGAPPETTIVPPGPLDIPGRTVWVLRVVRRS